VSILILQDTPQSNVEEVYDLDSSKYRIIGLDYSKTKFGVDGRSFVDVFEKKIFMYHLFSCIDFSALKN
jgi:hypothetical protein